MKKLSIIVLLSIITQSIFAVEQDKYPRHIAIGDNTQCFKLLAAYMTLPQHLVEAKKDTARYANALNFFRWDQNEEVTKFNSVTSLTGEDIKNIQKAYYFLQRIEENSLFYVYLTKDYRDILKYHDKELKKAFALEENNQ